MISIAGSPTATTQPARRDDGAALTVAGILNTERSFRRIKRHKQMPQLVGALHRHAHPDTETVRAAA